MNEEAELDLLVKEKRLKEKELCQLKHEEKLEKLGIESRIRVNILNVNRNRNGVGEIEVADNAKIIYNLSSRELSELETRVLEKGLKYGIRETKVNEYEILARFEQLAYTLNSLTIKETGDELRANLNNKNAFFQQLQFMSYEFIKQ